MPVITGAAAYPENLVEKMGKAGIDVDAIDALALAEQAGSNSKAVNLVLMGRLSRYFPDIPQEEWMAAVEKSVPAKFLELNKRAVPAGAGGVKPPGNRRARLRGSVLKKYQSQKENIHGALLPTRDRVCQPGADPPLAE